MNVMGITGNRLYENATDIEKSICKIKDSGETRIYPGHGNSFEASKIL